MSKVNLGNWQWYKVTSYVVEDGKDSQGPAVDVIAKDMTQALREYRSGFAKEIAITGCHHQGTAQQYYEKLKAITAQVREEEEG